MRWFCGMDGDRDGIGTGHVGSGQCVGLGYGTL